jgi:NADPH-dependent 2,4-dienoyl-CoA reductase/sulfur reductase-like enzyme
MRNYTYLIVGGGMTAASAIQGIREVDPLGAIGVISADSNPPYNRPPLSKGLWKGEPLEGIWSDIDVPGLTLHLGRTVTHLDCESKEVTVDTGDAYQYSKLLLATGASPRRLPFGGDDIVYFRSLDDYRLLRTLAQPGRRFTVIGGGFIGTEIAAALTMNECKVSMAFPDAHIGSRLFPPDLSEYLSEYYRDKGVDLFEGTHANRLEKLNGKLVLKVSNAEDDDERVVVADGVVAGTGVQPNIELAKLAGIEVDDGIKVDSSLKTNKPDVFAAGDVASFHNPALDKWLRVEHEDNANTMGKSAGGAMAGRDVSYDHLPFFYSDMFELGYEAVGEVDSRLEMLSDWKEPLKEGVVYYMQDGRVRGVLLWNIFGQVDAARRLIASAGPYATGDLKGRLPEK